MTRRYQLLTYVLVGMMCLSGPSAFSADKVVGASDLEQAMSKSLGQDNAARGAVRSLLQREDVRAIGEQYGLDVRRAEGAVSTLQGDELKRVSALAASADSQLAGGTQRVTISLVSLLLIIIIIILVAS